VTLKLDSGPGHIVASHASISKQEEHRKMGLLILSGLPNYISVQQEMGTLGPFKSATYARDKQLLIQKMKEQGVARMMMQEQDGGEEVVTTTARRYAGSRSVVSAASVLNLGFDDLATVVNGTEDDDISMKPFKKHFTKEKIIKSWEKVGFFQRNEQL
jgi:hypothetical protein